jgi:hypothetical protein
MPEQKGYRYKEKSENPHSRFWSAADDVIFYDSDPLTELEKLEASGLWDKLTGGKASPGRKVPNTSKK